MTKRDENKIASGIGRRKILAGGTLLGAASLLSACGDGGTAASAPAIKRNKRSLRLVTSWPKHFPGLGMMPERIAERVRVMSDGALDIRVYAAGELVPALSVFDAVSAGKADAYHSGDFYWQGKHPAYVFFSGVPFGMTPAEINAWMQQGGGQALWDRLAAGFNLKAMPAGNTGIQMGGWYKREIRSLEDFKGLRIRMPGLGGEVIKRLGATPVTKPGGEVFLALSQGNIDAAEWVGPWNDLAFGFHSIAKYYYYPGFQEPGAMSSLGFNLEVWNSLSAAEQALIATAAQAENDYSLAEYNYQNARALKTLVEEHGVQLLAFPDDVLIAAREIAEQLIDEMAAHDPLSAEIVQSFRAARALAAGFERVTDLALNRARGLNPAL